MVEHQLPKLRTRVRFPSSALDGARLCVARRCEIAVALGSCLRGQRNGTSSGPGTQFQAGWYLMIIIVNLATHYAGYLESGYELPAPVVPVRGMPAYARATAGLPIDLASTMVFVCTEDQLEKSNLSGDVRLRFPHVTTKVVVSPQHEIGISGAIRAALEHIDEKDSLIVHPASVLSRSALAARISVMGELGGLLSVMDTDVVGTGAWSADSFVTVDRTGRIDAISHHWSEGATAPTGSLTVSGANGATAEAISLGVELDPTTGLDVLVTALIRRRVPLGVDRVTSSWDLSHASGLGAYLAHR